MLNLFLSLPAWLLPDAFDCSLPHTLYRHVGVKSIRPFLLSIPRSGHVINLYSQEFHAKRRKRCQPYWEIVSQTRFHMVLLTCQTTLYNETEDQSRNDQRWVGSHLDKECLNVYIFDPVLNFHLSHFRTSKKNLGGYLDHCHLPNIALFEYMSLFCFSLLKWLL